MEDLEVKQKFLLLKPDITEEERITFTPYASAIFEINKLPYYKLPREKLDAITLMNSQMKSEI